MDTSQAAFPDLRDLVHLFYESVDQLGAFQEVDGQSMAQPYGQLLDHNHHMTVTVEDFHGSLVDVSVLEFQRDSSTYQRKILLLCQSDQSVVMFGIVRLHTHYLAENVRAEIESRQVPLGRILIENDVLRRVELGKLWQIHPAADLQRHFNLTTPEVTFGRTAIIHCNDQPAIELLEIVAPQVLAS